MTSPKSTMWPDSSNHESSEQQAEDRRTFHFNWIWRAAQNLVECPDFDPSPKWTAQRIGISVEKAVEALEGLERLGFIRRNGRDLIPRRENYAETLETSTSEKLLESHAVMSLQINSKLTAESKFNTSFMRSDEELMAEFAKRFMDLYREMEQRGIQKNCNQVIASQISFAFLTK